MKVAQFSHAVAEWALRLYWMALVCRIMQPDMPTLDQMLPTPPNGFATALTLNLFFFEIGVYVFWHLVLPLALNVLFISLTVALAAVFWRALDGH